MTRAYPLRGMLFCGVLAFAAAATSLAAGPLPEVLSGRVNTAGFAQVLEPRAFEFPRDHGPHPDYRQEWWYVTGNLHSPAGERFGFELTFFRLAVAPESGTRWAGSFAEDPESAWRTRQIYMAHFAVTDVARGRFRYTAKLSRGAAGLAGARVAALRVWIDDWALTEDKDHWTLRAAENGYELTLDAQALLAPVLNGNRGFSRKSNDPGSASYYYSIPRVAVRGQLVRDGKPLQVQGLAWVDREWWSGGLGKSEQGWDWFALQMGDGSALMFYALRDAQGRWDPNSAGTWLAPDGVSRQLSLGQVQIDVTDHWTNPRGARYPARWHVRVPTVGLDVDVRPVLADQELATTPRYWEGAVDVRGFDGGQRVDGKGYVELVGYAVQ